MKIHYLHLSDLHLTSIEHKEAVKSFNQNVVTTSMLEFIKTLDVSPDFVIITGDLAHGGKVAEYEVVEVFCNELLNVTGLDRRRLFIVSGNHDVDRDEVKPKHIKTIYTFDTQDEITETLTDSDFFPILMRKFADFNAFAEKAIDRCLFDESRFWFVETLYLQKQDQAQRINLIGLNSCLFAGYDSDDRQKLALGLYQVKPALGQLKDGMLSIGFFHHPFSCYHSADSVCKNLLMNRLDLILTGHLHEPSNAFIHSAAGKAVVIGAGAGFETRENENSFNLVEIDTETGKGKVQFYKYIPKHNQWKKDTDVNLDNDDGSFTFEIGKRGDAKPSETDQAEQHGSFDSLQRKDLLQRYLKELAAEANHLPWASVDPEYADPSRGGALRLADIYTALDTTELERMETEDQVRHYLVRQKEARRISAQEMFNIHANLVLLGDPGSGKTTLVNYLAYMMAQAGLDDNADNWLDRLKKNGPWDHGLLLPVRVTLRDFAAELDNQQHARPDLLLSHIQNTLKHAGLDDFWQDFDEGLRNPKTPYLLLLDGLDEVPTDQRQTVVRIIDDFARKYHEHRYLVTCRIYAYIGQTYQLQGFHQATLTPFNQEQIENFISAWYHELAIRGRFTQKEAHARAERLKEAATRPDLSGLAERPLLMTVMALLHTFRGQLPDDRVELYQWTVDLLLRRWEARIRDEKGLLETLAIPGLKITDLASGLYHVAFHAHAGRGRKEETADIREGDLRQCLAPYLNNDWNKAGQFVDYVRERAGLLIRHKPDAYTFPHRTFQEFMAACHLVGKKDYPAESAQLIHADPDRWRIVFVLAAGYAPRGQAISSVNALCPLSVEEALSLDAAVYRRASIAAEALVEIGLVKVQQDDFGIAVINRVRHWLIAAMQAETLLKPKERVDAGNLLSQLGDPRFSLKNWYLPDEDKLGFVEIPARPFLMGSDKEKDKDAYDGEFPQHTVEMSPYAISRYPVTVAQFRTFLADSGYNVDEEWSKYNLYDNHPVVYVSWDDAVVYCKWLTEKLTDRGLKVRLPTEAEWEKAARGTEGLIYPWGNDSDPNKANYGDTGIGMTSPVGCFPGGASLYGVLDMSGNVWEWCQDWYDGEYYADSPLTDPGGPLKGSGRVLRGGSWINFAGYCRCASRYWDDPGSRGDYYSFRLVLLPGQQASGAEQPAPQT